MFFPISDNFPKLKFPLVTAALIAANTLVYFLATRNPIDSLNIGLNYGAIPAELTHYGQQCIPKGVGGRWYGCDTPEVWAQYYPGIDFAPTWQTVFTSMFLHGDFLHLLGNMVFLFVFGWALENALGRFSFMIFYVVGGFAALLLHTLVEPNSEMPIVGASGAIAAVLAGYLVLFPNAKIWALFFVFPVRVRAFIVIGSGLLMDVIMAWRTAGLEGGGVAHFAHIGGFAAGAALTYLIVSREDIAEFRSVARVASGLKLRPGDRLQQPMPESMGPRFVAPGQVAAAEMPAPQAAQRYVAPPPSQQRYVAPPPPQRQHQPPAA